MAERRMFAQNIVLSDAFLDMPMSARCLYFTLGMFADDDGFIGAPKRIMRESGASIDDMKLLIAKRFVLEFDSGVIVIKHWRINNYLRNDRYKETVYLEEKSKLEVDKRGAYTEIRDTCGHLVYQTDTSGIPSIGKDRIGKVSIGYKFVPPTLEEVEAYCQERHNSVDPKRFFDYYQTMNWKDSSGKAIKNWKGKMIAVWEKPEQGKPSRTLTEENDEERARYVNEDGSMNLR